MLENDIRKPMPPNAAIYDINDPILTGLYNDGAGNLDMHRDGVKTITFYSTHTVFRQAIVISDSDVSNIEPQEGEALLFINDGKLAIKDSSGIRNVIMQSDRTRVLPTENFELKKALDENRLMQVQDLVLLRKEIISYCNDSMDSMINTFGIQITNMFDDHRSTISTLSSQIDKRDVNEFIFNTNIKLDEFKSSIEKELSTYIKKEEPKLRVEETTLMRCIYTTEYEKQIIENMYIKISNQDLFIYTSGEYIDNGESVKILDVLRCIDIFIIDDLAIVIVETLDNKTAVYFYEICGMVLIRQSKYKLNMSNLLYVSVQYNSNTPSIVMQNETVLTAICLDYDRISDRATYDIKHSIDKAEDKPTPLKITQYFY